MLLVLQFTLCSKIFLFTSYSRASFDSSFIVADRMSLCKKRIIIIIIVIIIVIIIIQKQNTTRPITDEVK